MKQDNFTSHRGILECELYVFVWTEQGCCHEKVLLYADMSHCGARFCVVKELWKDMNT